MGFPLGLWDMSLWLAVTAIILLITSEFLSLPYSKVKIYVDKKKLRNTAFVVSTAFLITVVIRIVSVIISIKRV